MAYQEFAPIVGLERHVECLWLERSHSDGKPWRDRVFPDGFVDLIYDGGFWVRGPDTRMHRVRYPSESIFVGVRLRPGAAPSVLGVQASQLLNNRVSLGDLWGDVAVDRVADSGSAADDPAEAQKQLQREIMRRLERGAGLDGVVETAVRYIRDDPENVRVAALATRLGVSERQLRRRFVAAVGYGPKMFARVVRFRKLRGLCLSGKTDSLANLATAAGYADQAHLGRECRLLAGITPRRLLSSRSFIEGV